MGATFTIVIAIIWSNIWTIGYTSLQSISNPLNGQHLRVIWPLWRGNPKGLAGPLKGGVILDYLATRLNFTYEMVRVTESRLESVGNKRGLFSYLWNEECDLLVHDILQTFQRQQMIDMTVPWAHGSFALLTVIQDETANIYAVVKPFQWPIWLGLAISTVFVIFVLSLLQRYLAHHSQSKTESTPITKRNQKLTGQVKNQYLYVIGNLMTQGFYCTSNRLPYRLVAGVWCLAAFVFVQAYTSTLITYVMTPVKHPLISSAYDIAENNNIKLLVRKAGIMDMFISASLKPNNSNRSVLSMKLRDKINSFPQSRCTLASECLDLLSTGSKNVFMDAIPYLMDAIRDNFKKDGKCNWCLASDAILREEGMISLALPKRSLYTKAISQGLLELMQTGIIDHWDLWFRPMPLQCMGNIKSAQKASGRDTLKMKNQNRPPSLSIKNLVGAFIILSFGCNLSLLVFFVELIIAMPSRKRRRLEKARNDRVINKSANNTQGELVLITNKEVEIS